MTLIPRSTLFFHSASLTIAFLLTSSLPALGSEIREYELAIAQQEVNVTGRTALAMTINGGIPGPTLRFTEGETARILVHNRMDVETSIHWHGLLVPPGMDGVPNLSFPPIAPGTTFTYEFPIRQSGTYWYHSHTSLQEQRGVYGSIVITPREGEVDPSDRDHVILLSDWTDTDPHKVLRTLRRGSEWYAVERGTGQSILGAARADKLGDYFSRELQRMPAMDIADVAYARFLANGETESGLTAKAGDTVRLRLIDGSATTFFHVEFAGGPMTVISADGIDVEPFEIDRLLIGVAETYDVLVKIPATGAYELRATAHDASGYASVWLGEGEKQSAPSVPYPNLYQNMGGLNAKRVFALTPAGTMGMPGPEVEAGKFDTPGMNMADGSMDHSAMGHGSMDQSGSMDHSATGHGSMDRGGGMDQTNMDHGMDQGGDIDHGGIDHGEMTHGSSDRGGKGYGSSFGWLTTDLSARGAMVPDGMSQERPWPPYDRLRARAKTAFDPNKPVREIRLTLDGDMERYVWFLNGKALSEDDDIEIKEGEIARFIMINRTMMHHPMHLHGHFFRVVNGQGDYAPLKHTVDVEPMSTTVIEFDANEVGDWFFHCHLLYHMKSGMARVVSYQAFVPPPEVQAVRPELYEEHWYQWGEAELMSHMSLGSLVAADTRNILTAEWEIGWQDVDGTEGELTLTWDRYMNRFLRVFIGLDVEGDEDDIDDPRGVAGLRYLLPFNLESSLWIDSDGEARLGLERTFHLTPRLALMLEAEYDTLEDWEGFARASYMLNQRIDVLAQWHSDYGFGTGLAVRF
ncbi:MAG: multicopper oxidase domain-containing protein [Acidobacteriota bacterium]|nr:multicopper oxidase domain-containing protein [Acidobacteriota bacterium]